VDADDGRAEHHALAGAEAADLGQGLVAEVRKEAGLAPEAGLPRRDDVA
jgi:hypothetical protein